DLASIPAQNALLKVIEEPPSNTQIVLTCTTQANLLPTITSRCQILSAHDLPKAVQAADDEAVAAASKVLLQTLDSSFGYSEAIDLASEYKDRAAAGALVDSLLMAVSSRLATETKNLSGL